MRATLKLRVDVSDLNGVDRVVDRVELEDKVLKILEDNHIFRMVPVGCEEPIDLMFSNLLISQSYD